MRKYILTEIERKVINDFLKKEIITDHTYILRLRIRKNAPQIIDDRKLITEFVDKFDKRKRQRKRKLPQS